jgi:hypothetical protein
MSDRNERIRAAFHDETGAPVWNRDGILTGVLQHTHHLRRQRLYRRTAIALVTTLVLGVAWVQLRSTPTGFPIPSSVAPEPVTFDSIPTNPAEVAVPNQEHQVSATTITVHEAPQSLMPLLGHRSSLSSDLRLLVEKRDELVTALNANPGSARADQLRTQIAGTEADIASTRTALRVVDNQLAALQGEAAPVVAPEAVTFSESPPIVIRGPLPGEPFMWAAGISLAALLIVFAALLAFRRTMRSAIDALSSLQGQASTQMSALTSGIEAIAIEVERLGENQRFMSKVIAGDAKEGVSARGNA